MNPTLIEDTQALLDTRSTAPIATRRLALQAALSLGYAAAAAPIMAQTAIKTPADGLEAGEITLSIGGQRIAGEREQGRARAAHHAGGAVDQQARGVELGGPVPAGQGPHRPSDSSPPHR